MTADIKALGGGRVNTPVFGPRIACPHMTGAKKCSLCRDLEEALRILGCYLSNHTLSREDVLEAMGLLKRHPKEQLVP